MAETLVSLQVMPENEHGSALGSQFWRRDGFGSEDLKEISCWVSLWEEDGEAGEAEGERRVRERKKREKQRKDFEEDGNKGIIFFGLLREKEGGRWV